MDIISKYANKQAVLDKFSESPELERLAFEFCKAFNCQVSDTEGFNSLGRRGVRVVIGEGIPAGFLYVDPNCARNKDNERIMSYMYKSPVIEKDRCSRHAGRDTRDSVKISSLIAAVRKCGEMPDMANILHTYKGGIRYAYGSIGSNAPSVSISIDANDVLAMVENFLGITEVKSPMTVDAVRNEYAKYQVKLAKASEYKDTRDRYNEGCYTVGYMRYDGEKPFYIVAETYMDTDTSGSYEHQIKFQGEVKRYATLSESPEVGMHVPIIRAWAEGQAEFDNANEFGLPRRDRHYPDIDMATGYSGGESFWFLIPKKAP